MKLMKTLGAYFNWTKVQLRDGADLIHLISCYLEGGEQTYQLERAQRISEVIKDILRQDKHSTVIVGGDFNNHLPTVRSNLVQLGFEVAIADGQETHLLGNQLDQVFIHNATVRSAVVSNNYIRNLTDHKAIRVDVDLKMR